MNKRMLLIISYLLMFFSNILNAKEEDISSVKYIASETLQEEIVLFTDRSLYSTNEQVFFSAKYFTSTELHGKNWSTVLYLELIKPDGTALIQNKYPLSNSGASGYVHIPEEILSGVYYLKAYTKWMRNYPTSSYGYCQIKLINPNTPMLNTISDKKQENILSYKTAQEHIDIALTSDKKKYTTREKVTVSFVSSPKNYKDESCIISVVRKGSKSTSTIIFSEKNIQAEYDTALFYPEIKGISLSGKILNRSGKAIEFANVNLSLLNKQSYFSSFTTNSNGEFFFSFPASTNKHDFFINAKKDDLSLNIELDKEFCSKPLFLKETPFELSSEEKILAEEICINAQIREVFKDTNTMFSNNSENIIERSFYGTPNIVLYTKDYIDLPYLNEFIFELVPGISFSYNKMVPTITTKHKHSLIGFPFLVLLDNIPISDLSVFAKIRTNKVERIEVIYNGYVLGNNKYSGILNIFSKEKDLLGIYLPHSSMFFSYLMYADQEKINFSLYPLSRKGNPRMPDRRNCLYWNPNFQLTKDSENNFTFNTSDIKGIYQIVIQAITENGSKLILADTEFVVE